MSGLRVRIDAAKCMGSGNCEYWAEAVFALGPDMVAVVIGDADANRDRVVAAAEHCPTGAITLDAD